MLCYVIWLFVQRLSQEAIQRHSKHDRLAKIKVFKLRRDADDIPCNITLRSAGGESFHSAGPTTAKARIMCSCASVSGFPTTFERENACAQRRPSPSETMMHPHLFQISPLFQKIFRTF